MESRFTISTKLFLALCVGIGLQQAYTAASRPIGAPEAYIYDRFVRPGSREVWSASRPDRDFLYALLEKRSVGLFHVSPFTVRLPSLIFLPLFMWSIWSITQLLLSNPWVRLAVASPVALAAIWLRCFSSAQGIGVALALALFGSVFAIRYLKSSGSCRKYHLNCFGVCLGLSAAARWDFAGSAAVLLLFALIALQRREGWILWAERVLLPAVTSAFILLVLPLTHANHVEARPSLSDSQASQVRNALDQLRAETRSEAVSIGTNPNIEPIVNFYRSQYRENTWSRAESNLQNGAFDYYILANDQTDFVDRRHLIVVFRDGGILLARKSPASM